MREELTVASPDDMRALGRRLAAVLRQFLQEGRPVAAIHLTTGELLDALREGNDVPVPALEDLRDILERCDLEHGEIP